MAADRDDVVHEFVSEPIVPEAGWFSPEMMARGLAAAGARGARPGQRWFLYTITGGTAGGPATED